MSLLLLLLLASVPPALAEPARDPAAVAALSQSVLPSLRARQETAGARVTAAAAYFAGTGPWESAFPEYIDAPLGRTAFLAVRAEVLRRRQVARAAERVGEALEGLPPADVTRWNRQLQVTCDAEDQADALEGRFLAGLVAGVARAPGLGDESVEARLAQLTGTALVPDQATPADTDLALAYAEEGNSLREWRRAAWLDMTRPDEDRLDGLVDRALAAAAPGEDPLGRVHTAGLLDRLMRVRPLLSPAVGEAIDAFAADADRRLYGPELEALRSASVPVSPSTRSPSEIQAEIDAAAAALAKATSAAAILDADPAATPLHRELLQLRSAAADKRLTQLRAERVAAEAIVAAGVGLQAGSVTVEDAVRKSNDAQQLAESARSEVEAAIRADTARIRADTLVAVRAEAARREASLTDIAGASAELAKQLRALDSATALATLDPARQPRLDAAYLALRDLVAALHDAAQGRAEEASSARARHDEVRKALGAFASDGSDAAIEHGRAVNDYELALGAALANLSSEQDAAVRLLVDAKAGRRAGRAYASANARAVGGRAFLPELAQEVGDVHLILRTTAHDLVTSTAALPALLTDATVLWAMLTGSLQLLVVGVAWWLARRRVADIVRVSTDRLQHLTPSAGVVGNVLTWLRDSLEPGDFRNLAPALQVFVRELLDLAASAYLVWFLGNAHPLLLLAAWVWLATASFRVWPSAVNVLLAVPGEYRPAVRVVATETRELARSSVRWVVGWRVVTRLLQIGLFEILAADKLTQLVDGMSLAVGGVLVAWLLWRWADTIRDACAAAEPSPVSRWAASQSAAVMRLPRAAVGLALLLYNAGTYALGALVASRRSLRWVGTALARRTLAPSDVHDSRGISDEQRARVVACRTPPPNLTPLVARLRELHAEWERTHRRGMVAVTGDRGMGLEAFEGLLSTTLPGAKVIRVPRRMVDSTAAMAWLAEVLQVGDVAALAGHLSREGPRCVVLLDAHLVFLRRVGGFSALRALFELMQSTSEEVFWVWACNGPTWSYLEGTPGAIDLGVFRETLAIKPATPEELAAWTLEHVATAGFRPSFDALVGRGGGPVDPRAVQRAQRSYFRLLEDLSQGRPDFAYLIWLESLRASDDPARIEHGLPQAPEAATIDGLGDDDLFVLSALAVHRMLDVAELVAVLNRPAGALRSACRRLEALTVLQGDESGDRYEIVDRVHPHVMRLLRRRAFLEAS